MKAKILLVTIILTLLAAPALADWDIAASLFAKHGGQGKVVIKVDLTADASSVSFDLFDYLDGTAKKTLNGLYPYRLKTVPIGTLSAAYTITLTDAMETATIADRSTTAAELVKVSAHTASGGFLSIYGGLTITATSPGDEEQITLYLEAVQ